MTGAYENANNAARAKYAAENPQLQKALRTLFALTGSDYNKQPDSSKAMWSQIASMLAPALAGTLGFDPGFATNRYDKLNAAIANAGPLHVTGSRLAGGGTKNYGYAYGAGNITVAATQGVLGKIDKSYKGGDADIMATLMSDYMVRNGTGDLVKNIDLGGGTSAEAMRNLENAYRTIEGGRGTMGLDDAKAIDNAIITKQALDKKAWRMMDKAGMDVGAFDETKNYYGSQEFKSYRGGELYRQLDEEVKANGGVDIADATGRVTRHGMEDVEMAKAISAGGSSMTYINQAVFDQVSENVKDNFKALKDASERLGMSVGEMEQFAKQTNMGALSSKRTVENIKGWTKKTEDIAAASNRTVKEVLQDQQNIADSLTGTGVTVTADKVLALQEHRNRVIGDDAKGGSIHTMEERTTMATRAVERASENNRGLYVARALQDSEFSDEATKAEAEELQGRLESKDLTFKERARINKRLDAIAKKSGIDVSDPAVRRALEQKYNKAGDLDRTIEVNARNNLKNYITRGAIGSKVREAYGAAGNGTSDAEGDIMALFNAVGQDNADMSGTKDVLRMARELRELGTDAEKEAYLKSLADNKGLDKYQIEAIKRFSGRTDEEMNAAAGLLHGAVKNGDSFNMLQSGHDRERNRMAVDQAARQKRVELAEGATNKDKQKSMMQQFAAGFFGEDNMSVHDINMAMLVKAESERNRLINEAGGDTGKIDAIKAMGVGELLNHAVSRMGFKEGEGPGTLDSGSIEVMSDVFDKDSKLTDAFKDKVRNDEKVKKWMEDSGKTFDDLQTDEEYIRAYEQSHGGSLEFTGVDGTTGKGTAVFMNGKVAEFGERMQRAINNKYKDAAEAWKDAGGIENNVTFDSSGNVEGFDIVDFKRYADNEYELDKDGKKTDKILHRKGDIMRDSMGNAMGMERHHINLRDDDLSVLQDLQDANGNSLFDESDFIRDAAGNVTGMSNEGLKKYGEHAAEVTKAVESSQGDSALPQWLQDNIVKMCEDMNKTSSLLGSVIDGNEVRTT